MMRFPSTRRLVAIAAVAVVGCSAEITVETQPNPAIPGEPLTVTFTVDAQDCALAGASAEVIIVSEHAASFPFGVAATSGISSPVEELESFCDTLADPSASACRSVTDPSDFGAQFCCQDPEFVEANPNVCPSGASTEPAEIQIREAIIAQARKLGLPVDEILAARGPQAATSGATAECTLISEQPGTASFQCALGDIPANGSITATATFSPSLPGRYFAFVFSLGSGECTLFPGGTGCRPFTVTTASPAPATSPIGLAVLVFGLIAIGALALRARHKSA